MLEPFICRALAWGKLKVTSEKFHLQRYHLRFSNNSLKQLQEPKELKYICPTASGKKEFCSEPCLTAYRKAQKSASATPSNGSSPSAPVAAKKTSEKETKPPADNLSSGEAAISASSKNNQKITVKKTPIRKQSPHPSPKIESSPAPSLNNNNNNRFERLLN